MNVALHFTLPEEGDATELLNDLAQQLRTLADEIEAGWYVDFTDLPNY